MAGVRSVIELSKYIIEALGKDNEFNLYRGKVRTRISGSFAFARGGVSRVGDLGTTGARIFS